MKKYMLIYCIILTLVTNTCKRNNDKCLSAQEYFLNEIQRVDLTQFHGVSITLRGKNSDGSRRLRAIVIHLETGERIGIPGYEFRIADSAPDIYPEIIKFAKHFGYNKKHALQFTRKYCNKMNKIVNKLKIDSIYSNLELGDFIVFYITDSCALVYKEHNASVYNEKWELFFSTTKTVLQNWYPLYTLGGDAR